MEQTQEKERVVICPGSFDPITNGHQDIIRRASTLFDRVIVLVSANVAKTPIFSIDEREALIETVCQGMENVQVDKFNGLLIDYVKESGAVAIVKGLRAVSDFDYEFQMALTNRKLMPSAETVFLTPSNDNMYLASSVVRQIAQLGGDIRPFVPSCIVETVVRRMREKF